MAARFSSISRDSITYSFWLAFDENGGLSMSRAEPGIGPRDRTMSLQLKVPRSIFHTPTLTATITLQGSDAPRPVIDVQASEAALKEATGFDVQLTIKEE